MKKIVLLYVVLLGSLYSFADANPYFDVDNNSTFAVDGIRYRYNLDDMTCDVISWDNSNVYTTINIPETVTYLNKTFSVIDIASKAFFENNHVQQVTIKNRGNISNEAFYSCKNLKKVHIENNGDIGQRAFESCENLNEVKLLNNGGIGSYAFAKCKISNIEINNNITKVGRYAFNDSELYGKVVLNTCGMLSDNAFANSGGNYEAEILIKGVIPDEFFCYSSGLQKVKIGDEVAELGRGCFYMCQNLNEVSYGSNVEVFGDSCFKACRSLYSIVIPNSVLSAGISVFESCENAKTIQIGTKLSSLSQKMFRDCKSVSEISIPNNVRMINEKCFDGCVNVHSFRIEDGDDKLDVHCIFSSFNDYSLYIGRRLSYSSNKNATPFSETNVVRATIIKETYYNQFYNCKKLKTLILDDNLTGLADGSFYGCSSLTSFTIPAKMEVLNLSAFYGCDLMKEVVIPSHVTRVAGIYATNDAESLNFQTVVIEDRTTKLEFYGCDFSFCDSLYVGGDYDGVETAFPAIRVLVIGGKATTIGNQHYQNCLKLKTVIMGKSIKTIGRNAFYGCTSLTSIAIGDNVDNIGNSAFYGCTSLNAIVIGENTNSIGVSIGDEVFYGCASLNSVVIGDNVKSIGGKAFYNCRSLRYVSIGKNVSNIGNEAFSSCTFSEFYSYAEIPPTCGAKTFFNINGFECTLFVPRGSSSIYTEAVGWRYFWNVQEMNTDIPITAINLNAKSLKMKPGQVYALQVTILPDNASNKDVEWISSNVAVASINNGIVAAIAPGNATIYAVARDGSNVEQTCFVSVEIPYILGDVNGDGNISVTDAAAVVNFILGNNVDGLSREAADVNGDGEITITDEVHIVHLIINSEESSALSKAFADESTSDLLTIGNVMFEENNNVRVMVNSMEDDITASQFDIILPAGVVLEDINAVDRSHMVSYIENSGVVRVVCYSSNNDLFRSGQIAELCLRVVSGNAETIDFCNIELTRPDLSYVCARSQSLNANGLTGINSIISFDAKDSIIYDLNGHKVKNIMRKGTYIINGKKVRL